MTTVKRIKKFLLYFFILIGTIVGGLTISAYLFRDRIIAQFIREMNKSLNTEVRIGHIDVSVFEQFPQLSLVLTDVYVEDSHAGTYPLLTASRVSFQLNPLEVYRGIYHIKGLTIEDSETNLKINSKGANNFTITKEVSADSSTVTFELKNIQLRKARVRYADRPANLEHVFFSQELMATVSSTHDRYTIGATGDITTEQIRLQANHYLEGKTFNLQADLEYDDAAKSLSIRPSTITLNKSDFVVQGTYQWKNAPFIQLGAKAQQADIQTLLSLLPESTTKRFEKYKSKGEAYFSSTLEGKISDTHRPALSVEFGLRDAELFHPETDSKITHVSVEGSFASSDLADPAKAVLVLKNIRGELNQNPFESEVVVQNFIDSDVIIKFKGLLDAGALAGLYPVKDISEVSGELNADLSFEGKLSWLKSKATAQKATTSGSLEIHHLSFRYGEHGTTVQDFNGNLRFNNNDLALSNVSGKLGNTDFVLNGFFKNVITFLLFDNQPIGIEADLQSAFMDLDQLFAIGFGTPKDQPEEYEFSISPNLYLNFNCRIDALRYKRFHAQRLNGDLLVKNQLAVSRNITLRSMGGNLTASGIVDATNAKAIDIVSSFNLNGIYADSIFYVFENFGQDFIQDKHIRGQTHADVAMEMTLNQHLKLFPETLIADIGATIKNGELNNFEPMQALNKYLDDEGLDQLRFADLKNDIHIENKTVYIPQMVVRSNVTTIQISGTHTFDQQIDYRLVAPLVNRKKINVQEAGNAIETLDGQSKLFLKITGTTRDYRVTYDTEAVKKKIVSDLKKEVQELKDAFKTKGMKKKKELELSEEEFDWDNNR
jgi:hypothetical protein